MNGPNLRSVVERLGGCIANVSSPLIVGPESESEQWASDVAARVGHTLQVRPT